MTTATQGTSRTAHLLALMKKGDDAFNARDFAAVDEVHHPDMVAYIPGLAEPVYGKEAHAAAKHLLHRCGVRVPSVDRLGESGDVRDHVRVVDLIHRGEVAGVERVVALLHEREKAGGPAGAFGRGSHDGSFGLVGGVGPLGGTVVISL